VPGAQVVQAAQVLALHPAVPAQVQAQVLPAAQALAQVPVQVIAIAIAQAKAPPQALVKKFK
jgi:hypothetical protein